MAWAVPQFTPERVNAAGRSLGKIDFPVSESAQESLDVINNWRSSHSYPLNTFQITLRHRARKIEKDAIVAQRSKRLESIHRKLLAKPTMRMTQMQDIAGCRAVLKSVRNVNKLVGIYKNSKFEHKLRGEKDYVNSPKSDGYRCRHLVYEYIGSHHTSSYTGLRVEIQIRTFLQHAWATAVEAVGIFTRQALKSNQGDQDWLRFFSLMGSAIASIERTPLVPGTPHDREELVTEIKNLAVKLRVKDMLQVYNATIETIGAAKDAKYFIIELNPEASQITVRRFKAKQSAEANNVYTLLESRLGEHSTTQIVLVSVENISSLKRAYPNYFLDTDIFSKIVDQVLDNKLPTPLSIIP